MHPGLQITFDVLAESNNECAIDALTAALDMAQREIKEGALRVLLKRPNIAGQRELVRQWPTFSQHWKSMIAERPEYLSAAIAEAMRGDDPQLCDNACEAILRTRDYDLAPALVGALENREHARHELLGQTLLKLAESLYEELASPRDYRIRHDPQLSRQFMLSVLEPATERFYVHQATEILEAFLIIVNRDSRTLNRLLQSVEDAAHRPVVELLSHSPRPGIMRLLINSLDDPLTPQMALNILANRRDVTFLRHLFKKLAHDISATVKFNLHRIDRIGWLDEIAEVISFLNDKEQQSLVWMLTTTGVNRSDICGALRTILRRGEGGARADAVKALNEFRQKEVQDDILLALSDSEPNVQANALRQLRNRRIPGAIDRLLDALESPHEEVHLAVRQSLSEFNFVRYMAAFDKLAEDVRKSTGKLVFRLDVTTLPTLQQEFVSEWRKRRVRAVDIAQAMDIAPLVEFELLGLLRDQDHFLQVRAIDALADCRTPRSAKALEDLLSSNNESVKQAAEDALQRQSEAPAPTSQSRPSGASLNALTNAETELAVGATP